MRPSPDARHPSIHSAVVVLLCLNLGFLGLGLLAFRPLAAGAQNGISVEQQAILTTVRELTGDDDLAVQQRPDGSFFATTGGKLQAVLLAATNADGELVTRCVETLEEAAAFLAEAPSLRSATTIAGEGGVSAVREAFERDPELLAAALASTQFSILVADAPGEGFNDPTRAAPVGGNTGTTIGQQRLRAFEYAAAIWATVLQSTVQIEIEAQFNPLTCTASSAVLGSAGPQTIHRDFVPPPNSRFPGAEQPNTWYVQAMANQRMGTDIGEDPDTGEDIPDIITQFNSNLDQPNCLGGRGWYYGLDGNETGGSTDLVTVLLHEFAHGLGFISLVNGSTGANVGGINDVWNSYLTAAPGGGVAGTLWKDLTPAQRAASATSNNLVWGGAATNLAAAQLYGTVAPRLSATPASGGPYSGGLANFGPAFRDTPLTGALIAATDADEDGAGAAYSASDACSPLSNAAAVAGKIALVSRGLCAYNAQVRNLQAAGAIAAVIADNVGANSPPLLDGADIEVTIPSLTITQAAGNALRSSLANGAVNVAIALSRTNRSGFDSLGRVKMFAPGTFQGGSSVSHFDTAIGGPNLLMEPAINADITQNLDLTDELMRDIGWFPDRNFNALDDRREVALDLSLAASTTFVRPGQPFTFNIIARNRGYTTTDATVGLRLPDTFASATWTASYSGGASGPFSGTRSLDAAVILPPGSSVTFTVSAVAPEQLGPLGPVSAQISRRVASPQVDLTSPADDGASLGFRVTTSEIFFTRLPLLRR